MRPVGISSAVVDDILRRTAKNEDNAAIARALGLTRLEVAAILARHRLRADRGDPPPVEPAPDVPADLWLAPDFSAASAMPTPVATVDDEEEHAKGIYVGDDAEFATPVTWDPTDARSVQNPHFMIMGQSGSGKTYAQQCLVAELAHAGIPSIIFDYGQSFERNNLERAFVRESRPEEHLVGEEGLALNPLQIFDRDTKGPYHVATRVADVFDAAFRLGDIQKKVLIDALLRAYEGANITPSAPESWRNPPPTILALRDAIDDLAADRSHYPNHKNAAGLSARLTTFFMLASFRSDTTEWSWDQLIDDARSRVHILQFRGLEGKTQRVLVELLLWHLFFHLKTHGQTALRLFCILDEAHHLSFRENGPVSALLREARKFGLGIIFASQHPEDFSPVAYGNSATKLILQTADPSLKVSKFLTGASLNYDRPEEIRDIISRLQQGDAFFITQNRGHVLHVADFPRRATFWGRQ